jgi:hypothetical protein
MRLPQFTAEASLAKTNQHYVLTPGVAAKAGGVFPQGVIWAGGHVINYTFVLECFSDGRCTFKTAIVSPALGPPTGVFGPRTGEALT